MKYQWYISHRLINNSLSKDKLLNVKIKYYGSNYLEQLLCFGKFCPKGWAFVMYFPFTGYSFVFSTRNYLLRDGRTTFALPDLEWKTNLHFSTGPGLSAQI
jgi:microcystin-dependent protein